MPKAGKWTSLADWCASRAPVVRDAAEEFASAAKLGRVCPYCGQPSQLVDGSALHPTKPYLYARRYYLCSPCDAWVSCHPDKEEPLGSLANSALRAARSSARRAFNSTWSGRAYRAKQHKPSARARAYRWLARMLDIKPDDCAFAKMDARTCERVVMICTAYNEQRDHYDQALLPAAATPDHQRDAHVHREPAQVGRASAA